MNENQETIADIVAEKRRIAQEVRDYASNGDYWDKKEANETAEDLEQDADSIEAAWKRMEEQHKREIDRIVLNKDFVDGLAYCAEAAKRERDELIYAYDPTKAGKGRAPDGSAYALEPFKREMSKKCPKSGGDFGQFGNAAALREALAALIAYWDWNGFDAMRESQLKDMARSALSAPPRNCDTDKDVKTLLEEYIAMRGFKSDNQIRALYELALPVIDWLLAPATERKGDAE